MVRLTDTHCHLVSEKLFLNASELVTRAHDAGVTRIINIAYNDTTTRAGLELVGSLPNVWTTCGIQPHDASEYSQELAEQMIKTAATCEKLVAIGEIGLDAHYTLSPMEQQEACFEHFLDLACVLNKPVVIHVRETHRQVYERLASRINRGLRGVIHCFTGTTPEAREFLNLGFHISFSGIVTFKSAHALAETARYVPADRLLIETDAPYLAPVPYRGKTNEPAFLTATAAFLAQARGCSVGDIAHQTNDNATQLFSF
jgi:TatD DNase family protein